MLGGISQRAPFPGRAWERGHSTCLIVARGFGGVLDGFRIIAQALLTAGLWEGSLWPLHCTHARAHFHLQDLCVQGGCILKRNKWTYPVAWLAPTKFTATLSMPPKTWGLIS